VLPIVAGNVFTGVFDFTIVANLPIVTISIQARVVDFFDALAIFTTWGLVGRHVNVIWGWIVSVLIRPTLHVFVVIGNVA
jgi:hypothetical protein